MNARTKNLTLNLAGIMLAIIFVFFGAGKFIDPTKWIAKFEAWSLPGWFVAVTGYLELAGAVGIVIPKLRSLAGIGLALFMIGAVATHAVHGEIVWTIIASAIMVACALVGWYRSPETLAFFRAKP